MLWLPLQQRLSITWVIIQDMPPTLLHCAIVGSELRRVKRPTVSLKALAQSAHTAVPFPHALMATL